jgi:hypothetical protein
MFLNTLNKLEPLSSVMNHWLVMDYKNLIKVPLSQVRSDITALVSANILPDDDGVRDPRNGYHMFAQGGEIESEARRPRSVDVTIRAGCHWFNSADIDLGGMGSPPDPDLVTYPLFIEMLKVLASTWPCPWVEAHAYAPNFPPLEPATSPLQPPQPLPPRETYYFPWLLYLSAPFVRGLRPPRDLICDRTPGGGVILSAVADRLDPTHPDHVRRSRLLESIITERLPGSRNKPMLIPPPRVGPY